MLLENNKRDYISDQQETTQKMSINADVQSHIIKVLTEHTYNDPLGSSIREAVSNAVDSVTEAGTNEPVIVRIIRNAAGGNDLIIEDKGLGLDDVSFNKYIMGLGESTKRDNPNLLGGYGAGAKAWLAYTNNFNYICRKDGVERKYLIFKGAEFPEATLVYEKPTTEVNGVIVTVGLKQNYNEVETCKLKIREQLKYLDNVYYDIPGFQNNYTVIRSKDFQFSTLDTGSSMHISLKNISYPIDWNKLGINQITFPVGLRFDDYSELKPIFNRESIMYNNGTVEILKKKIEEVSNYFVGKWNELNIEYPSLLECKEQILNGNRTVELQGKLFDVNQVSKYATVGFNPVKVKGLTHIEPHWYATNLIKFSAAWEATSFDDRGTFRVKHIGQWSLKSALTNAKKDYPSSEKFILINQTMGGNLKEWLRKKYAGRTYYIRRDHKYYYLKPYKNNNWHYDSDKNLYEFLKLKKEPREKWRAIITEFFSVLQMMEDNLTKEFDVDKDPAFIKFVEDKQAIQLANRKKGIKNSVLLNKEEGEVTIFKARKAQRGNTLAYDKTKISVKDLAKIGKLVVYIPATEKFEDKWLWDFTSKAVLCVKFNPSEIKHVEGLQNLVTLNDFMKTKPFARMATAFYIERLLKMTPEKGMVYSFFTNINNVKERIKKYKDEHQEYASEEAKTAMIDMAKEHDYFDQSIMADVKKYEEFVNAVGFLKVLPDTRYMDGIQKKIVENMIYIMLKHKKVNCDVVENFDLVAKPKPAFNEAVIDGGTDEEDPFSDDQDKAMLLEVNEVI